MQRLKSGWTTLKLLRVALGLWVLLGSLFNGEVSGIILGGIFTLFSLFTDGVCCGSGACDVPVKKNPVKEENTAYEEVGKQ